MLRLWREGRNAHVASDSNPLPPQMTATCCQSGEVERVNGGCKACRRRGAQPFSACPCSGPRRRLPTAGHRFQLPAFPLGQRNLVAWCYTPKQLRPRSPAMRNYTWDMVLVRHCSMCEGTIRALVIYQPVAVTLDGSIWRQDATAKRGLVFPPPPASSS